ncbi:uncharacterized protein LOC122071601 [Macadamia integrifolia]|uniref:uncharacterized protein LOC122071601 n=1 Tax=Macadamia integrifolia TaxID=60698 RepID=UPI001C5010B4|nr:uncharacterized protein LOC122071601 [Macadamia integrifolia]
MAPFEALYGMKCRTPLYWDEVGERKILRPKLVQTTCEKVDIIRERIRASQSTQKSYTDNRRKPLEFEEGEKVFLKISPIKGIKRFGKRGKLSPRYIGPFEILGQVGKTACRLALPPELDRFHNVFHVSMLKRYILGPSHVLPTVEPSELDDHLSYEEQPKGKFDRKEYQLWSRTISSVPVKEKMK